MKNIKHTWNAELAAEIQKRIDTRTKPVGALGLLEDVALRVGLIQGSCAPSIKRPVLFVFAADHGLADEGVSAFPKAVTAQMVLNFLNGGAAVNVFSEQNGFEIRIVDAGVDYDFGEIAGLVARKIGRGTKSILRGPAMSGQECRREMEVGGELVDAEFEAGSNLIAFGEMGIGNTSSAALIMSRLLNMPIEDCAGRGTGLDDAGLRAKVGVLRKALEMHTQAVEAEEVLRCFGGFEIAMIVGAALRAAELGMVILVDGFIVSAAMLVAGRLDAAVEDYMIFAHLSDEHAHGKLIAAMQGKPLLRLGMRLGEGSGAAVCLPLIYSAVNFLNKMAGFEDAAVSGKIS